VDEGGLGGREAGWVCLPLSSRVDARMRTGRARRTGCRYGGVGLNHKARCPPPTHCPSPPLLPHSSPPPLSHSSPSFPALQESGCRYEAEAALSRVTGMGEGAAPKG